MNLPNLHDEKPKDITAFFTGHRILTEDKGIIAGRISYAVERAYESGYRRFYCGCALGFDTLAAVEVIRLREKYPELKLCLAIPCADQPSRWSETDQRVYQMILDAADEKTVLSPVYYKGAMLTRNRFMADRASLCICYMNHYKGGTANTIRYALLSGSINIINLAMDSFISTEQLREDKWNYTYISHSVRKNAHIVRSYHLSTGKLTLKST